MRLGEEFSQDVRYGARMLAKHPGFTAVAVLTLAIGIGANVAIFSLVNEVFLRSAPAVTAPDRLVALGRSTGGQSFENFGHLMYLEYRDQAQSFTGLAASRGASLLWKDVAGTVVLDGQLVSGNYFSVLGVKLARGRGFLPEDDRAPGTSPVAILSYAAWTGRFARDPAIIGRRLRLGDAEFTIVGVAAEGFRGLGLGDAVDAWLPLMMEAQVHPPLPALNSDFFHGLGVVGRLKPGVSAAQAEAELAVLAARIERPSGTPSQLRHVVLTPHVSLPEPGWRAYALSLLALLSIVTGLVLLIVCANVAGLLLARSASRRKELAVRLALGASRGRIVRQLLGESVTLAALGALAGLVVSYWIMALLRARTDENLVLGIDRTVLLFVTLLVVFTAVASGLVPALQATRGDVVADLKDQPGATRRRPWLRDALVMAQVGVSLVLLTGAGLFVRTLQKAGAVDIGFETQHLLLVAPNLELAGYTNARSRAFYRDLAEGIAALPGVQSVSRAGSVPRYGHFMWGDVEIVLESRDAAAAAARVRVEHNEVGPRYFETLGVGLVRGRGFTALDDSTAPRVAVVNEAMTRQLWPADDPIGKRLRFVRFMGLSDPVEIVGVVRDSRTLVLEDRVRPEVFVPLEQSRGENETVLVRVSGGADAERGVVAAISRELRRRDPALPPVRIESLAERMQRGLSDQRLHAEWTSLFGGVGLLLAAIGLYGSLAFTVSQRTRDIGIRMALGAESADVLRMVLREGLAVAGAGAVAGCLASIALTRLIVGQLYGVTATDPIAFGVAMLVLLAAAAVACWVPARRATLVDPLVALRHE